MCNGPPSSNLRPSVCTVLYWTSLQDSFSSCSVLSADSNQESLSSEESLLPKIIHPPWGQPQSNDQKMQTYKALVPLPPFSETLKSTPSIRASVEWAEAFVENGPHFNCVWSCFLQAPTRASLVNFLHTSLQTRVRSGKLDLWLYCLQRHIKPRCVSQWPTDEFLRKWLENHNEEKWQVRAGSWEASSSPDNRGLDGKPVFQQ